MPIFGMKIEPDKRAANKMTRQVHPSDLKELQDQVWRHVIGTWRGYADADGGGIVNLRVAFHATNQHIVVELLSEPAPIAETLAWAETVDPRQFEVMTRRAVTVVMEMFAKREWDQHVMATPTRVFRTHRHW